MHQDATWYGCRPQPRGLCVRWRPSPPPQKGGGDPTFSVHVYCGQTTGWIKITLGTKVGLSPGDSVLDGDPAPSPQRRRTPSPIFRPFLLWPNSWMHQDATWYGGRPQPRRRSPGAEPPNFRPMSIVAKRLDGSVYRNSLPLDIVSDLSCLATFKRLVKTELYNRAYLR